MSVTTVNFLPSEVTSKEVERWNEGYSAGYSECEAVGKTAILDLLNLGTIERQKIFHTASVISILHDLTFAEISERIKKHETPPEVGDIVCTVEHHTELEEDRVVSGVVVGIEGDHEIYYIVGNNGKTYTRNAEDITRIEICSLKTTVDGFLFTVKQKTRQEKKTVKF